MKPTKNDILFGTTLLFAIWFMVGGIFWIYWFAPLFAYPFGILSFSIWIYLKRDGKRRNRAIPILLLAGLLLSISMLLPMIVNR